MCVIPLTDLSPYGEIKLYQKMPLIVEEKIQYCQPASVCVYHITLKKIIIQRKMTSDSLWGGCYGITLVMGV